VFRLAPPATAGGKWHFETIYIFKGGADGSATFGNGPLVVANGRVFGTTPDGGTATTCGKVGCGTFFMLTPPGALGAPWTKTVLFNFPGGNGGGGPISNTGFDANGSIYVATHRARGAVVRLDPCLPCVGSEGAVPRYTETVLYQFSGGINGFNPNSLVL